MIMNDILKLINLSKKIAITFHESPDGDSIGSALALIQGLKKLDKNAYIVSKEKVPSNLTFLPFSSEIGQIKCISIDTDCVIVVDCGNIDRINAENFNINSNYKVVNIDHHVSNDMYGDYNYTDTNASAVAEIIYQLLKSEGIDIDKNIAKCLYTSILTDSGSFKYSNTTSFTHTIAGDLINTGIDFTDIHRKVFDNKPYKKIKLFGKVIDKMKLYSNQRICLMEINKDMINELDADISDTGDIINIGTQIDTVKLIALLKQNDDSIKISLRSKCDIDVCVIAEKFNGGGHPKASGLTLKTDLENAKKIILDSLEKELI